MRVFKILYAASMFTLVAASLLVIYIGYLLFWPTNIIDLRAPLKVDKPSVYPGELINIKLDYCKYVDLPARISVSFIGNVVTPIYGSPKNLAIGCRVETFPITVPISSSSGVRSIEMTFVYRVNKVRVEVLRYQTEPFTVLDKTETQKQLYKVPEGE